MNTTIQPTNQLYNEGDFLTSRIVDPRRKHAMLDCPLYADERDPMRTRIKGLRRTNNLHELLNEKGATAICD
jgi:hypothetical protein